MKDSSEIVSRLDEESDDLRKRVASLQPAAGTPAHPGERFLRDVLDVIQDGVSVLDAELNVVGVNALMEKMYAGVSPLVGKKCYRVYQKRQSRCPWCPALKTIETGRPGAAVVPYPCEQNPAGWMELATYPLKDAEGNVTGVIECVRDITERKRAEERLKTSHRVLRALAARLEKAREDERAKIALRIHDELGHSLAALVMDLAWLDRRLAGVGAPVEPERIRERIKAMSGLVEEAIRTAKATASDLRPGVLDDLGLVAALEWEVRQYADRTGVRCTFRGSVEDLDVDKGRSTAMFRICQEMLTNVALHAKATIAEVVLKRSGGKLVLEVKDNGVGISGELASSSSSLGIVGMRERVGMLGGALSISGRRGRGTRVTASIPLRRGDRPGSQL